MALAGCNDVAAVPVRRVADARGFARLRGDALWRREWRRYATLATVAAPGRCVVVDCLTLWLANLLDGAETLAPGADAGALPAFARERAALLALIPDLPGTVIFVAYLSAMCRNPLHTATQYALLTALAAVGRTYLSASAGFVAEATGWPLFFAICMLAALPSLILLAWLQRRGHFAALQA